MGSGAAVGLWRPGAEGWGVWGAGGGGFWSKVEEGVLGGGWLWGVTSFRVGGGGEFLDVKGGVLFFNIAPHSPSVLFHEVFS